MSDTADVEESPVVSEDGTPLGGKGKAEPPKPVTSITCYTADDATFECPLHERITNAFHKAFTSAVRKAQSADAAMRREIAPVISPIAASKEGGSEMTDAERTAMRAYMRENMVPVLDAMGKLEAKRSDIEETLHSELASAIIAKHKLPPQQRELVESEEFWEHQDREKWGEAIRYFRHRLGV